MVAKRIAVRGAIVALGVGAVLVALGMVLIVGARHTVLRGFSYGSADGIIVSIVWDVFQLATGIVLALVGTGTGAASLTYLILSRKGQEA